MSVRQSLAILVVRARLCCCLVYDKDSYKRLHLQLNYALFLFFLHSFKMLVQAVYGRHVRFERGEGILVNYAGIVEHKEQWHKSVI